MRQLMHQLLSKHRVKDFSLAMPVPCWTCVADVCDECMDCLDLLGTEVSLVTQSQLEFTTGSRQPLVAHHVCDVEAKCGGDPGHCSQCGRRRGGELSLIHISEPTRLGMISYAVFC